MRQRGIGFAPHSITHTSSSGARASRHASGALVLVRGSVISTFAQEEMQGPESEIAHLTALLEENDHCSSDLKVRIEQETAKAAQRAGPSTGPMQSEQIARIIAETNKPLHDQISRLLDLMEHRAHGLRPELFQGRK